MGAATAESAARACALSSSAELFAALSSHAGSARPSPDEDGTVAVVAAVAAAAVAAAAVAAAAVAATMPPAEPPAPGSGFGGAAEAAALAVAAEAVVLAIAAGACPVAAAAAACMRSCSCLFRPARLDGSQPAPSRSEPRRRSGGRAPSSLLRPDPPPAASRLGTTSLNSICRTPDCHRGPRCPGSNRTGRSMHVGGAPHSLM